MLCCVRLRLPAWFSHCTYNYECLCEAVSPQHLYQLVDCGRCFRTNRFAGQLVVAEGNYRTVRLDKSAGARVHAAGNAAAHGGESGPSHFAYDHGLRADHCCARVATAGAWHAAVAAKPGDHVHRVIYDAAANGAGVERNL